MDDDGPKGAEIDVQKLWSKYEDIAMHFNDLLMRLRTQSLAGIAAISTLVGLFTKDGATNIKMDWLAAMSIFIAMAFFWIAIWCLDFKYYNKLLVGAVTAIKDLEERTGKSPINSISMSTTIEAVFRKPSPEPKPKVNSTAGVFWFYVIVLLVILAGAVFSGAMYYRTAPTSAAAAPAHAPSSAPLRAASAGS